MWNRGPDCFQTIKLDTDATQHFKLYSSSPDPPDAMLLPAQGVERGKGVVSAAPSHTHSATDPRVGLMMKIHWGGGKRETSTLVGEGGLTKKMRQTAHS